MRECGRRTWRLAGLSSALAFPLDLGARPLCRRLRGRGCANCQSLPQADCYKYVQGRSDSTGGWELYGCLASSAWASSLPFAEGSGAGAVQTAKASRKQSSLSRVAKGVSGPSSSCVWNPRVFADDARGWQCPFVLCLHPQGCLRRGVRASAQQALVSLDDQAASPPAPNPSQHQSLFQ